MYGYVRCNVLVTLETDNNNSARGIGVLDMINSITSGLRIVLILTAVLVDLVISQCPFYCACVTVTRTVDCRPSTPFKYSFIPDDAPITTRVL